MALGAGGGDLHGQGVLVDIADRNAFIVDYVEVPLLARISFAGTCTRRAARSWRSASVRRAVRTSASTEEIDVKDDVESFDLGVVGAVGIEFGKWVFDGRYTHGLSDLDPSEDGRPEPSTSLSAGIKF